MSMEQVKIDRSAEESLISGHLWVFSNQVIDRSGKLPPGEIVEVRSVKGRLLGIGYHNPHSLISVRLLSRAKSEIDERFFVKRINDALQLRGSKYGESFRIINSESDFLPGLIIDKYDKVVVIQFLTFGMDRMKDLVLGAVTRTLAPEAIVVRNDAPSRKEEGLTQYIAVADGRVDGPLVIDVGPLKFLVDPMAGHKTGFYFDQRMNRVLMKDYAYDRSILDLFSYTGGFGLHALYFGARSVTFVDASAQALEICKENMRLNNLSGGECVKADGFDFLKSTYKEYEVVVLDPPSFIKSRKYLKEGEQGYIDLHKKALRRMPGDGYLFTFSCSHHMKRSRFKDLVRLAAYGAADLYLLEELSQSGDHPVLLTIPETDYLKGLVLTIRKRR
jgi:23S rRNA (cytosine1962-C5)-methyltransferase